MAYQNTHILFDMVILPIRIYLWGIIKDEEDLATLMFYSILFTIGKNYKQHQCPTVELNSGTKYSSDIKCYIAVD